ncbi:hypothetical protein FB446DRAFT_190077 [Lentinula raphanica]|nr:hypothetical protein FB446DRAFT_190077 [Lentinula raphanica]
MRLNTGFAFCALVCFSTILHPVCGSPLPSSNGMRTPSLTSDSGSESESNSQLHTPSESHRTLRLESFVAGEIPVRIELDFLESCVIEGLKPFASTKLGIAHPIIDTHNFAQREQPFPLSTKPLDDGQQVLTYMCIFTLSPNRDSRTFFTQVCELYRQLARLAAPCSSPPLIGVYLINERLGSILQS